MFCYTEGLLLTPSLPLSDAQHLNGSRKTRGDGEAFKVLWYATPVQKFTLPHVNS